MQVSARGDYAVRAAVALASAHPDTVSAQTLADEQSLPHKFLEAVLADLRRAGLVRSVRGADGGYRLAHSPTTTTVGAILRAVDGPLAGVRGQRPEDVTYGGAAAHLPDLWIAVRAAVRNVLDEVTLAQVASGKLPARVRRLVTAPDAWEPR
ncbi:Rrf2 family transcriptional regulator [Phytomonospora sp. NPDC050363]|uniref:RrF2 family transcriptional regulator n=1 Tax=Phytomonospora sp. NPDC050363 TaxID=3155642 RepID=UPI0033EB2574